MRDPKLLLPLASLVFLVLSFFLVLLWGFRYFYGDKKPAPVQQQVAITKPSSGSVETPAKISAPVIKDTTALSLQEKLQELIKKNSEVLEENKRLSEIVSELRPETKTIPRKESVPRSEPLPR